MLKSQKAFTLVELLVVIAIVGLLASVVFVSLNNARQKSRDSRRIGDVREIANALAAYSNDNAQFPSLLSALPPTYIPVLPTDPSTSGAYTYNSDSCTPANQAFVLRATLERDNSALDGDADGTVCTVDCADSSNYYCINQ